MIATGTLGRRSSLSACQPTITNYMLEPLLQEQRHQAEPEEELPIVHGVGAPAQVRWQPPLGPAVAGRQLTLGLALAS